MPISLPQIANNSAVVRLTYNQDTIAVTYYPGRVTEKALVAAQAFGGTNAAEVLAGFVSFNEMLATLIKDWDVYEDEAQTVMFPIEAARFAELPFAFRMAVFNAIMEDFRPEALATQTAS